MSNTRLPSRRTRPCGRPGSPPPAPSPARRSDKLSPPTSIPSAARRTLRHTSFSHSTLLSNGRAGTAGRPPGTTAWRCIRSGTARTGRRSRAATPWPAPPRPTGSRRGWRRFCGISRFREYRIFGARDGQGRTRHRQCAESCRTNRPNLASFSRVSTRGDRVQRNLGRSLSSSYHIPLDLDSLNFIS